MGVEVKILKAFVKGKHGGNPAGVVINEEQLSWDEKQEIARIVGVSETVFINAKEKNNFEVSFFTPNKEVDLCGHGTIAAFQCLVDEKLIGPGQYYQKTKAGTLDVIINTSEEIFMEQNKPYYGDIIEKREEIAKSLGISVEDLVKELPIQIVSTGIKDIIVGVKDHETLNALRPDFNKISMISEKYDTTGYHVFSLETFNNENANCRNFAPYYAIDEESATGTASGALASYLFRYNRLNESSYDQILFYQGEKMGTHSAIQVKLKVKDHEIKNVYVGGRAGLDGIKKIKKY